MPVEPIENSTWRKIEKLIPSEVGPRGVSNRHVLDAAIYVLVENCGWLGLDVEQWGFTVLPFGGTFAAGKITGSGIKLPIS